VNNQKIIIFPISKKYQEGSRNISSDSTKSVLSKLGDNFLIVNPNSAIKGITDFRSFREFLILGEYKSKYKSESLKIYMKNSFQGFGISVLTKN